MKCIAETALQHADGQAGVGRKRSVVQRLRQMLAEKLHCACQRGIRGRGQFGVLGQRSRHTRRPHDLPACVVERDFVRHTPDGGVIETAHEFHAVHNVFALQNPFVIEAKLSGDVSGREIGIALPNRVPDICETVIEQACAVHRQVATLAILDPKLHRRQMVKQSAQRSTAPILRNGCESREGDVRFHDPEIGAAQDLEGSSSRFNPMMDIGIGSW